LEVNELYLLNTSTAPPVPLPYLLLLLFIVDELYLLNTSIAPPVPPPNLLLFIVDVLYALVSVGFEVSCPYFFTTVLSNGSLNF
jgi:hypothetical protein